MSEDRREGPQEAPVDGPDPGAAGGSESDLGAASQDAPGGRDAEAGDQGEQSGAPTPNALDSNERADRQATVVEPD